MSSIKIPKSTIPDWALLPSSNWDHSGSTVLYRWGWFPHHLLFCAGVATCLLTQDLHSFVAFHGIGFSFRALPPIITLFTTQIILMVAFVYWALKMTGRHTSIVFFCHTIDYGQVIVPSLVGLTCDASQYWLLSDPSLLNKRIMCFMSEYYIPGSQTSFLFLIHSFKTLGVTLCKLNAFCRQKLPLPPCPVPRLTKDDVPAILDQNIWNLWEGNRVTRIPSCWGSFWES